MRHLCSDPGYASFSLPERRCFIHHTSLEVFRKATPLLTDVSSVPQVGLCVLILGRESERRVVCAAIPFVEVPMGPDYTGSLLFLPNDQPCQTILTSFRRRIKRRCSLLQL